MQGCAASFHLSPTYTQKKIDIKTKHYTVHWFMVNRCKMQVNYQGEETLVKHRNCYEIRHYVPCMFFHDSCTFWSLKNNKMRGGNETPWDCIETIVFKSHEVPVLTANLITTARGVHQDSVGAAGRRWHRRFWKTLLRPSLVVTCAQVTAGLPHGARLDDRSRNAIKIKTSI